MYTVPLMRGKSLINTLVGVSASWYCEGVGGDDSKENAKHQHEGTMVNNIAHGRAWLLL